MEVSQEERAVVERVLKDELQSRGEGLVSVWKPSELAQLEKNTKPPLAACLPFLAKKWKLDICKAKSQLYALTSQGVYVVLDLEKLEREFGKKVEEQPFQHIHFLKMESVRTKQVSKVPAVVVADAMVELTLYGHGTGTVLAINKGQEECMNTAILETLPAGTLENRISHN